MLWQHVSTLQFSLIAEIVAFSTNTKMKCCYSTQFDWDVEEKDTLQDMRQN